MSEPTRSESKASTVAVAFLFSISLALAGYTVVFFESAPVWVRAACLATAIFFGWLGIFATANTRVKFMRWFPWF